MRAHSAAPLAARLRCDWRAAPDHAAFLLPAQSLKEMAKCFSAQYRRLNAVTRPNGIQ